MPSHGVLDCWVGAQRGENTVLWTFNQVLLRTGRITFQSDTHKYIVSVEGI